MQDFSTKNARRRQRKHTMAELDRQRAADKRRPHNIAAINRVAKAAGL